MPDTDHLFTYLYLHTSWAHGGPGGADDYAARAKELGYTALACSDYGSVAGWPGFAVAARQHELAPVFGLAFDIQLDAEFAPQVSAARVLQPALMLAATGEGLRNLVLLHNLLLRDDTGVAWCLLEDVAAHVAGTWLVLVGEGEFGPAPLAALPRKKAVTLLNELVAVLPTRDVALIGLPQGPEQVHFVGLAQEANISAVALPAVRYPSPDLHDAHLALHPNGGWDKERAQAILPPEAVAAQYADYPDALDMAGNVAASCVLDHASPLAALRGAADGDNGAERLRQLVIESAASHGRTPGHGVEVELAATVHLGLALSLVAAHEIVSTARGRGLYLGVAEGTAAEGELAALLGLSSVNPFDVAPTWLTGGARREKVLPGLCVAALSRPTLLRRLESGSLALLPVGGERSLLFTEALRMAGQARGVDPGIIADLVRTAAAAHDGESALRKAHAAGTLSADGFDLPGLLDLSAQLAGSTAGLAADAELLVVSADSITLPIVSLPDGGSFCPWNAATLEDLGAALVALCGDPELDTIARAIELAGDELPWPDADEMRLIITAGDDAGLPLPAPQNGAPGVLAADIAALLPDDPEDTFGWAVFGALLCGPRGPHPWLSLYVRRRVGQVPYPPLHAALRPLLEPTNGLPLFREQIAALDLRLASSELVRPADSLQLQSWLSQSRSYTMPYGEALAAGRLMAMSLRLKVLHPATYLAAAMQSALAAADMDGLQTLILEAQRGDIRLLPPDARYSQPGFTLEHSSHTTSQADHRQPGQHGKPAVDISAWDIRWGLALNRRLVPAATAIAIAYSQQSGTFTSLEDLLVELDLDRVTPDMLEELIRAGAFDYIASRSVLLSGLPAALRSAHRTQQTRSAGAHGPSQPDLLMADPLIPADDTTEASDVAAEKDPEAEAASEAPADAPAPTVEPRAWEITLLGHAFSLHPTVRERLPGDPRLQAGITRHALANVGVAAAGQTVSIPVMLTSVEIIAAPSGAETRGEQIALAWLEDSTGSLPALIFPPIYTRFKALCQPGVAVIMTARVRLVESWEGAGAQVVLVCEHLATYETERQAQKLDVTPIRGRRASPAAKLVEQAKAERSTAPQLTVVPKEPMPVPQQPQPAVPAARPAANLPPGLRLSGPSVILTLPASDNESDDEQRMRRLKQLLTRYPGATAVILYFPEDPVVGMPTTMPLRNIKIDPSDAFCAEAGALLGAECVQVVN